MLPSGENTALQNPYGAKGMLQNVNMFFGRANALKHIYSEIRDKQSVSVVGQRRIGKSSLLNVLPSLTLQQKFGYNLHNCIFAFIDLEEHAQETCEDFFDFTIKQLLTGCQGKISLSMPEEINADALRNTLDQIQSEGYHAVLLLDEFDSITTNTRFDPSFFALLRAQANASKVSYVTASKEPLEKVCHSDIYGSPFFNIFSSYELGPLLKEEAMDLIMQPAERAGLPFTLAEVEWILKHAGRHPFFIQRACYYLFEEKISSDADAIDLKQVARQIQSQLMPHFAYIWKHMDSLQQEELCWEVRRINASQRLLPAFSESFLFRAFVYKKCSIDLTSITVDDLCTIMDKLGDLRFLGGSKLGYLNLVYLRLREEERVNVYAKGAIVDDLLQSAIETIRPSSTLKEAEKETESDWRIYNILHWRHRDKIRNEEIAARLGIGLRHFYRERKRAAQILLQVLMRMETSSKLDMEA